LPATGRTRLSTPYAAEKQLFLALLLPCRCFSASVRLHFAVTAVVMQGRFSRSASPDSVDRRPKQLLSHRYQPYSMNHHQQQQQQLQLLGCPLAGQTQLAAVPNSQHQQPAHHHHQQQQQQVLGLRDELVALASGLSPLQGQYLKLLMRQHLQLAQQQQQQQQQEEDLVLSRPVCLKLMQLYAAEIKAGRLQVPQQQQQQHQQQFAAQQLQQQEGGLQTFSATVLALSLEQDTEVAQFSELWVRLHSAAACAGGSAVQQQQQQQQQPVALVLQLLKQKWLYKGLVLAEQLFGSQAHVLVERNKLMRVLIHLLQQHLDTCLLLQHQENQHQHQHQHQLLQAQEARLLSPRLTTDMTAATAAAAAAAGPSLQLAESGQTEALDNVISEVLGYINQNDAGDDDIILEVLALIVEEELRQVRRETAADAAVGGRAVWSAAAATPAAAGADAETHALINAWQLRQQQQQQQAQQQVQRLRRQQQQQQQQDLWFNQLPALLRLGDPATAAEPAMSECGSCTAVERGEEVTGAHR
jgi:hypothetical protein